MRKPLLRGLLTIGLVCSAAGHACGQPGDVAVQPREVRKIVADGRHHAFTALVRYRDALWLAFRTATDHHSPDGDILVLRSSDEGRSWQEARRVDLVPDDRDPQFLVVGQRLILYDNALQGREATAYATLTDDGETWSEPRMVHEPRFIIWKPTAYQRRFYATAHRKDETNGGRTREVRMLGSADGLEWETISTIRSGNWESETTLLFGPGGQATAFLRQKYGSPQAQILESRPPYETWAVRTPTINHFAGHSVTTIAGTTYFLSRTMDDVTKQTGLMMYTYSDGSLVPYCRLPAGGDCSYAEAVESAGDLLVSYYSSHEGTTNIYLARVPLAK